MKLSTCDGSNLNPSLSLRITASLAAFMVVALFFSLRSMQITFFDGYIEMDLIPPEASGVNKSGRYVSMCAENFDGRRIGNQLFNFAAMLHVAHWTGRRVAMVRRHPHGWIDSIFRVPVTRVDDIEGELCPCVKIGESRGLAYETSISSTLSNRTDIVGKNLLICGWTQSWRYTTAIESQLRRYLRPQASLSSAVSKFFEEIRPQHWNRMPMDYFRVGLHIRVGDIRSAGNYAYGYTIPEMPFFEAAIRHVIEYYNGDGNSSIATTEERPKPRRMQLIVASDCIGWCKSELKLMSLVDRLSNSSSVDIDLRFSSNRSAGFDLVMLTMCDVIVITTGTYGWWAAWLANRPLTIYYKNWPRPGSPLADVFERRDYFPRHWIPIDGPYFTG